MRLVFALALAACTPSTPPPRTAPPERAPQPSGEHAVMPAYAEPTPEPAPPPEPAPYVEDQRPTPGSRSLVRLEDDLDGDGDGEVIELFSDGTLRLGDRTTDLTLHHEPESYWAQQAASALRVVDLRRGDGRREVVFWQYAPGDEDPSREYNVLSLSPDGEIRRLYDPIHVAHTVEPQIRGDGAIRFLYTVCDSSGRHAHHRIEYELTREGSVRPRFRQTRYEGECELAACPFVYANGELAGEILRDVVGAAMETEQSLSIPTAAIAPDGTLSITLREEKAEVTFLDSIALWADGRILLPRACEGDACSADDRYALLREGDALSFTFDVGHARELRLIASGYYVPLE
jgi:hypothetical protein